jgi:ribonucleotide monophosphatase NagD (HAD superfamily)
MTNHNNFSEIPKTIICDIDGCILKHKGNLININLEDAELLTGVKEKFDEWDKKSYKIIFLTGRKESMREVTEKQLKSFGLFWDVLVMGATRGERILINDLKPGNENNTATAINMIRNQGFVDE